MSALLCSKNDQLDENRSQLNELKLTTNSERLTTQLERLAPGAHSQLRGERNKNLFLLFPLLMACGGSRQLMDSQDHVWIPEDIPEAAINRFTGESPYPTHFLNNREVYFNAAFLADDPPEMQLHILNPFEEELETHDLWVELDDEDFWLGHCKVELIDEPGVYPYWFSAENSSGLGKSEMIELIVE
jgi:hypothetical protein